MSLTFQVAVPSGRWPSFNEMNALIAKRGYPLAVLPQDGQSPDDPMAEADGFLSFHAVFRGQIQEMDCYHSVYTDDLAAEITEFLQDVGSDHRVEAGAHDWSYGYGPRISPEYLAPYCILAGILVLDCGGYGFEGQGPSFGADAHGRAELAEAEQQLAFLDRPSAQQTTPSAPPSPSPSPSPQAAPRPASRKLFGRVPINIWTIFAGIIVLLLMAECVDNTIYNFTGTQG